MPPATAPLPYRLSLPARLTTGVIFASPHSGRDYPDSLLRASVLDARRLRSSEDAYVDELLEPAVGLGAALITALVPRAYVDLNRAEDELDPALIAGLRRTAQGARIAAGLGVIPRVVAGGRAIYAGKIGLAEAEARLGAVWRPYHARLQSLIAGVRAEFGHAVLVDVHSMPSEALSTLGAARPQIVLGDRYGASASAAVMSGVEAAFEAAGLRCCRNAPFAGAYIAQRYGQPEAGVHVVQVEIDRALYLDEANVRRGAGFEAFAEQMAGVMARIAEIARHSSRLAAE